MTDDEQRKIFTKNLNRYIDRTGKTQKQIADDLGINPQTVNSWCRGKALPRMGKIQSLADYFGIEKTDLIEELPKINQTDNVIPTKINRDVVSIPVLGSVPAGVPVEAIEDIIDTIEIPQEWLAGGAQFIGLKVTGTSMYPMYLEGDTVVIEIKHDCDSGQDAIIYVNGYDATLKTIIKNDDGTITLKPRNPEWPEKTYGPGDDPITILGPVVQMQREV